MYNNKRLVDILGIVLRMTVAKMLEFRREFMCTKCKHIMKVNCDYDQRYLIVPPRKCLNPESCKSTTIIAVKQPSAENCKDYQEIKIQVVMQK